MSTAPTVMDAFTHCPRCGVSDFKLQGNNLRICSNCDYHHHFNPVCAVGAIISDDRNRILLIERGKEPAKGKLGVPGGFTDVWESVEDALHREVEEEIGLKLHSIRYLTSHANAYLYRGVIIPTIDFFFSAKTNNFNVVLEEGEITNWRLMEQHQIHPDDIAFESMRVAIKIYWQHNRNSQASDPNFS